MAQFRALLFRHSRIAALLVALALCLKAIVPAGYMVDSLGKTLTISICDAQTGATRTIDIPADDGPSPDKHGDAAQHCGFATISMQALSGADPVLLTAALLFLFVLGFAPLTAPSLRRLAYETPPLRGPPLQA